MKSLSKIALAAAILTSTVAVQAEWVSGYARGNRTCVASYYRTPVNGTPYDNLSYRGYPSQQPGYVSPQTFSCGSSWTRPKTMPYDGSKFDSGLLPSVGIYSPQPLHGRPGTFGYGF